MNKNIFKNILNRYKENYNVINDPNDRDEIYKWPAVRCCIDSWNIDAEDFLEMFKSSMRLSQNIIDNDRKHPVNGIIFLCNNGRTEEVRDEFKKLLIEEEDIRKKQDRAEEFKYSINKMIQEIAPEKWSYEQDRRDPLMYLAFINPEKNYMFKAEPARVFSNYVEFGDDIGEGQTFRLDNYFRLCDEVLSEIENDDDLKAMLDKELVKAADRNGFDQSDLLEMPGKLRIIVYDIMYCANSLNLYNGLPKPVKKGSKEERDRNRTQRIKEINEQIVIEDAELGKLLQKELPEVPNVVGLELTNKKYGKGTVIRQKDSYVYIDFNGTERTFNLPNSIVNGYLKGVSEEEINVCKILSDYDKQKKTLTSSLQRLATELSVIE